MIRAEDIKFVEKSLAETHENMRQHLDNNTVIDKGEMIVAAHDIRMCQKLLEQSLEKDAAPDTTKE